MPTFQRRRALLDAAVRPSTASASAISGCPPARTAAIAPTATRVASAIANANEVALEVVDDAEHGCSLMLIRAAISRRRVSGLWVIRMSTRTNTREHLAVVGQNVQPLALPDRVARRVCALPVEWLQVTYRSVSTVRAYSS